MYNILKNKALGGKMSFGKILEEIRKEKGDSFRKLAEKIGFSYSYIQQIEGGSRPASLDFLQKITEIYVDKKDELELAYCEEKLPKSIYEKIKSNEKIDEVINTISKGDSFNTLYSELFSKLDTEGQKQVMELIVGRLEKLSDEGKYKKDEKLLKEMKEIIREI